MISNYYTRWKSFNKYYSNDIYKQHLELLNKKHINIYSYPEILNNLKILIVRLVDRQFISKDSTFYYYIFSNNVSNLKPNYQITIYNYLLNNNKYYLDKVYYIVTYYYSINNQMIVLISLSDNDINLTGTNNLWLFNATDNILANIYSATLQCRFIKDVDWNNCIVPEKIIHSYIELTDIDTVPNQFTKYLESFRLISRI